MFDVTIAVLDKNNALWKGRPAFADAVTRVKGKVGSIDDVADKQATPITGKAQDKGTLRDSLEAQTQEIADQLAALAAKDGKGDLAAQVQMSKSSLDQMTDSDLEQTAERVETLATTNLDALVPYEVKADDVTALTAARLAFKNMKTAPRQAQTERKAQTETLPEVIAEARSIFRNEIDKMMTKFKTPEPDFYKAYFAARVIVDKAATHKSSPAAPPPKP